MDTNENKQKIEDKAFEEMREEGKLREEGRIRKEEGSRNSNRLWIWLGALVLIFIIIYWLFAIGTFGDLQNWFNG
ncbi:MAG: hypothetical protein NC095_01170 [Muribaculum sp.]|nr:hypothetical protein [Muribaculum sp.]